MSRIGRLASSILRGSLPPQTCVGSPFVFSGPTKFLGQSIGRHHHMGKGQQYGDNPIAQRKTDLYKQEYVQSFVRKWDDLIDWDARATSEGDFFIRILQERGVKRVLDVATGTGFHSIRLLKAGFDVTSADGSPEMLAQAFENARRAGLIMRTVHADWRWLSRDIHNKFDAVICLGNSLTHLFSEQDRRKALAEFYAALTHDGVLILDQRNYDGILDNGFTSKHIYYYCGDNVSAQPEYVDEGLARFQYRFPDGTEYHLNMYPLRKEYVRKLMHEVGFQQVKTYGDFQETHKVEDPDFFVHVAEKLYKNEERTYTSMTPLTYSQTVDAARDYYNSSDADRFYATIWGEKIFTLVCMKKTRTLSSTLAGGPLKKWPPLLKGWMRKVGFLILGQDMEARQGI